MDIKKLFEALSTEDRIELRGLLKVDSRQKLDIYDFIKNKDNIIYTRLLNVLYGLRRQEDVIFIEDVKVSQLMQINGIGKRSLTEFNSLMMEYYAVKS